MSVYELTIETEAELQRLVYLATNDLYKLTGQLVVATRNFSDPTITGSARSRASKALQAIPGQIERTERTRASLITALKAGPQE